MATTFDSDISSGATFWSSSCSWISSCCHFLACCGNEQQQKRFRRMTSIAAIPEPHGMYFFQGAAYSLRHPLKLHKSGNCDACLFKSNILGVADGVNSVADEGINPLRLPKELLNRCFQISNNRRSTNEHVFDAEIAQMLNQSHLPYNSRDIIKHIVCRAAAELEEVGSTTLCLAAIQNQYLQVANIGDSGLLQFRLTQREDKQFCYCLVGRTQPGCHSFNTPYQITRMAEPDLPDPNRMFKNAHFLTQTSLFELQDGDIIIIGSDGLLDNLYSHEIGDTLNKLCLSSVPTSSRGISRVPLLQPERVAKYLVEYAVYRASPAFSNHQTPFSESWYKISGKRILGGKPDDTTAVVAYVEASQETSYKNEYHRDELQQIEKSNKFDSSEKINNNLLSTPSPPLPNNSNDSIKCTSIKCRGPITRIDNTTMKSFPNPQKNVFKKRSQSISCPIDVWEKLSTTQRPNIQTSLWSDMIGKLGDFIILQLS